MIKFKKDDKPYKLTFHCVADGRIASHVRGGVSDIASPPSHAIYHYLTDQNKNITGLADYNRNMVDVWDYDAFGNVIFQSGRVSGLSPLGFSS